METTFDPMASIKIEIKKIRPLAVTEYKKKITLLYEVIKNEKLSLHLATSSDGISFKMKKEEISLKAGKKHENLKECSNFALSLSNDMYILTYSRQKTGGSQMVTALSKNLETFHVKKATTKISAPGLVAPSFHFQKEHVLYFGTGIISLAFSKDMFSWKPTGALVLLPRSGFFDHRALYPFGAAQNSAGTLVLYDSSSKKEGKTHIKIGGALFAYDNPYKILWRSEVPLFEQECAPGESWKPFGAVFGKKEVLIFLTTPEGALSVVPIPNMFIDWQLNRKRDSPLKRYAVNPIIEPNPHHDWESETTFNPAALHDGDTMHLLYRAIGKDGVSRLGYAKSDDGIHFDKRSLKPVFSMRRLGQSKKSERKYDPVMYPSGGSWGGTEDPRMVNIDGRVYVTFNVFDGWDFIRIGMISIDESKFFKNKWDWSDPVLLSPPGEINKNWVLFPEKINGKYAILHSISPEIQIDYVDSLDDLADGKEVIKSKFSQKTPRQTWDTWVRGAGPPPLKTEKGWLVLYHATSQTDSYRYKLGALLLDINNPKKVIARSHTPLLCPDLWYENEWKPGIVYACGAAIIGKDLYVYYGGGDKVVCVATAPLKKLLSDLKKDVVIHLKPRASSLT